VHYLPTFISVDDSDLDDKKQIKDETVLDTTRDIIKNYRKQCNEIAEELPTLTCTELSRILIFSKRDRSKGFDFIAYGREVADKLKSKGHAGNASTYLVAINAFQKYVGRESFDTKTLSSKIIEGFIDSHKTKKRAPSLYLATLKAIYNRARKEFRADIDLFPAQSPFDFIDLPASPGEDPHPTTPEAVKTVYDLPDRTSCDWGQNRFNLAKDVFILSFCLVGMNTADLYSCTEMSDNRITYNRQKTKNRRRDGAKISIRIEPEVQGIIDKYRDKTGKRVFCFYQYYSNANTFSAAIEKGLKQVQKEITKGMSEIEARQLIGNRHLVPYTARHTWASIARNKVGVNKYDVSFRA
jgi:hypothetical protein